MLPSKSKSGLSDTSNNKSTPTTPRVSKLARGGSTKSDIGSPSPFQKPRFSIDRSPKSVESKPLNERHSPKISTPPDKHSRASKGSELQAQLGVVQDDLKKAKEQLASVEQERNRALEELKDAKKLVDEANEKVKEAIVAQKRAEESLEIEKFRADEMEQAGIETAQKREEERQKELESIQNQHGVDVAALLSTTQELQKVRHEFQVITDAKNTALSHADDAMKIAEINAEKVGLLSAEVNRLKSLLDSKVESVNNETIEQVRKLESEVDALRCELGRARSAEEKLIEMGALVEGLRVEVTDAKKAELDTGKLVYEWKKKAEFLEVQLEEASQSERTSLETLASVTKQLEESNASLQGAESETASLRGKVESLEIEVTRLREDLEDSTQRLDAARQEALEMGKAVEAIRSKLQALEEEKLEALSNEKDAASKIETLSEERNKLVNELEIARDECEKVKKAMEGLASALQEVSAEARETQERLLAKQTESEDCHAQIEQLRLALKNAEDGYEAMLDEARHEIVRIKKSVERFETEARDSRAEWDAKELNFMSAIKKSEEELVTFKAEIEKMGKLLEGAEHETEAAKEDGAQMLANLRQAESKIAAANEAVEEAKAESMLLKERLLDKENELQSITQENDELRIREAAAVEKVNELSTLLTEVTAKKSEQNGELSNGGKDNDSLTNSTEIPAEDEDKKEAEKPKLEDQSKEENGNGNGNQYVGEEAPMELELKMQNSCNVVEKDLSSEMDHEGESVDDELDSKRESGFEQINGLPSENMVNGAISPTKQQQKKKKALLQKFGSLLKKKSNHK